MNFLDFLDFLGYSWRVGRRVGWRVRSPFLVLAKGTAACDGMGQQPCFVAPLLSADPVQFVRSAMLCLAQAGETKTATEVAGDWPKTCKIASARRWH